MRKLYSYRNRLSTRGTTTITDENGSNVYLINGRWGCTPASCRSTLHLICLKPKSSNAHLECCQSLIYTKTQVCRLDSPILRCQSRNAVREKAQLADHGQPFDLQLPRFSWSRMHHDHQRGPIGKRRLS